MKKLLLFLLIFAASLSLSAQTTKIRSVTVLPATCSPGDGVQPTDTVAYVNAGTTTYEICATTNTWVAVGSNLITSVFGRTGSIVATAGDYTFDKIGAGSNLNALTFGNAGSLKPVNLGQVAGNQAWLQPGLVAPSTTGTLAGGSVGAGQGWLIQYTLNSALGETLPSILVSGNTTTLSGGVCSGGGSCTLTITAPTLPSGYTSYTVYACNTSVGPCTVPQKAASCTAITGNCTFTAPLGTNTSGVPTVNTAIIQPPNVQAATNTPFGFVPSLFFPKTDGNYYPWAGVEWNSCDATNGPPLPCGTPMFIHRTWFSDQATNTANYTVSGKNCFVCIDHSAGVGTVTTNQDRTLWLNWANPANDATTRYGVEGLQSEVDFACNGCTINGSPDAEITTVSAQMSWQASTGITTNGYNSNAVMGRFFRSGAGTDSNGMNAGYFYFINQNTAAPGGTTFSALKAQFDGSASSANATGIGLNIVPPATSGRFGFIKGIFASGAGFTPAAGDRFIDQRTHNWHTLLNSDVGVTEINNEDGPSIGALPIDASLNITGGVQTTQIASAWSSGYSAACSGGASTFTYQFVAVDVNGGVSASTTFNCNTGTNPLTSGNPAVLNPGGTVNTSLIYRQAARIDVFRVGGPMATGKIGSLTCNNNIPVFGCAAFSDTGIVAGAALPTGNTTGGMTIGGDFTLGTSKGQHVNTQAANNDFAGTCTASAATTCTITFTRAYTAAPICTATDATNITTLKVTPSTTSLIITTTGSTSDVFDYICVGNPN